MKRMRKTFVAHWIICLVCLGVFSFAWRYGVPQLIWASDASYMTSAIAALVVGTAIWLGWQAWHVDSPSPAQIFGLRPSIWKEGAPMRGGPLPNADFGQEAQLLAPALGMLGTVIGLSMQAKALVAGAASLGALSTALFTTGVGIAGFIVLKVLTLNLEAGIKRAGR